MAVAETTRSPLTGNTCRFTDASLAWCGKPVAASPEWYRCRFLAAFLVFSLISLIWAQAHWGALSPADFPVSTWTACAIDDFLSNAQGRRRLLLWDRL